MLKVTLVFSTVLAIAVASVGIMELEPIPEKFKDQTGCYIEALDAVIPFGESFPSPEGCQNYRCSSESVSVETCGIVSTQAPCTVVEDESKPYPGCCPTIQCP